MIRLYGTSTSGATWNERSGAARGGMRWRIFASDVEERLSHVQLSFDS
jgi:hypothetical protein